MKKHQVTAKSWLSVLLCMVLCFSLIACGKKDDQTTTAVEPTAEATTEAQNQKPNDETTAAPATEATTAAPTTEAPTTAAPSTAAPTTEAPTTAEPTTEAPTEPEINTADFIEYKSLKDTYADQFLIGTIYAYSTSNGAGFTLAKEHFNVMTPENDMKPQYMQPSEGTFNFTGTDAMVKKLADNNILVVGHNLCWHQQSGNFLGYAKTREEAIEQLKNHIYNVAGHYKGQLISWDVVNEAIADGAKLPADGDWTKCLRKSQWYNSIGPDYLEMAFQFAREADPTCKLYYNDYNLNEKNKADIVYAMVSDFKKRGIPIDGIGMQAHYQSGTSIGSVQYSIELFESIPDIEISMTELDVTVEAANGRSSLTKKQEIEQAVFYAKLFKLYKEHSDRIARVTFWGMQDNFSWRKEKFPCLFNKDNTPKEAVYAVLDPDKYLELHAVGYGDNRTRATATYGTPKVDGSPEALWDNCETFQINTMLTAWNGATGTMKLMWDEDYLYVFVDVRDKYLTDRNSNAWEQDSVELFLDQKNNRTAYYEEDDGQYRVNFKGKVTIGDNTINDTLKNGFIGKGITVGGGYYIEAAIPWVVEAKEGLVCGFDAQINDTNTGGSRESVAKFNDPSDSSYQTTENFGEVILKK